MQSSYVLVNGQRYHYYHANLSQGKRPALLLHGLASNGRIWEKTVPFLEQGGLAMYAPDLRGHGLSDQAEDGYDFDTILQDLAAFTNLCDIGRPVIVGHSWGAMLAVEYAARFAIGPRAPSAVVLVDGGVIQLDDFPGATWETTRERLTPPRLAGMQLTAFMERLAAPGRLWQPDDQDKEIILANFEVNENEEIAPHLKFDHHMQIVEAMWNFPTYERFSKLYCPALALPCRPAAPAGEGERDFLAFKSRGIERIQQVNPHVKVHWMEDSIHDVPLQHPQQLVEAILNFLADVK